MEERAKTRILELAQKANLAHPGLPLVEVFLNDAVDGDQAARYLLEAYSQNGNTVDFTQFLGDWKDLVRLCKFCFIFRELNGHIANDAEVYVESSHSRDLSWKLKRTVVRREQYRCCLTGEWCRFWGIWNVFPIIPPTAFCIKEVGTTPKMLSGKVLILFPAKTI